MTTFKNFSAFRAAYKATGNHFFDRATMRFFNSRIESGLLNKNGKQYFITSECYAQDTPRTYSLRRIDITENDILIRNINFVFKSKASAKERLRLFND